MSETEDAMEAFRAALRFNRTGGWRGDAPHMSLTLPASIMGVCSHCGNPFHPSERCDSVLLSPRCPQCGAGTYVHRSGVLACVNSGCDWSEEP